MSSSSKKPMKIRELAEKIDDALGGGDKRVVDDDVWSVAKSFVAENGLVSAQIHSFNDFIYNKAHQIVEMFKQVVIEEKSKKYILELGELMFGPPTFMEKDESTHDLYPVEALQRNITYGAVMYVDVTVTTPSEETTFYEKKELGVMPIMTRSDLCHVSAAAHDEEKLAQHKEDFFDNGGYFVVAPKGDGAVSQRRILIPQERSAPNKVYIFSGRKVHPKYSTYAEVRSTSNNVHTITTTVGFLRSGAYGRISAVLPWIDATEIPLGVLFFALGVTDYKTIAMFVAGPSAVPDLSTPRDIPVLTRDILSILTPTLEYSYEIQTKEDALFFIGRKGRKFIKNDAGVEASDGDEEIGIDVGKPPEIQDEIDEEITERSSAISYAKHLLSSEFFSHVGNYLSPELREIEKAKYLGYVVKKLILVLLGKKKPESRDHYMNKRILTSGVLLAQQFYGGLRRLIMEITKNTKKALLNGNTVNISSWIKPSIVTNTMQGAITGNNWTSGGPAAKGISQLYEQFNYVGSIANARKVTVPIAAEGGKVIEPRDLHGSHFGGICPADTPEGKKAGLVKNLAFLAHITVGSDFDPIRLLIEKMIGDRAAKKYPESLGWARVFLNGTPIGFVSNAERLAIRLRRYRREAKVTPEMSVSATVDEVNVFIDAGRLCRPLLVVEDGKLKLDVKTVENLNVGEMSWTELLASGAVELIDKEEEETCNIIGFPSELEALPQDVAKKYTHCEIHPSLIYGVSGSIIPFSNHNQCIFQEEVVYMEDGSKKKIKDVVEGDRVANFDPKTGALGATTVVGVTTTKTNKQMYELVLAGGQSLTATFDHRIITPKGWKRIDCLSEGDFVGVHPEKNPYSRHLIFIPIGSKTPVDATLISDITTDSPNQSFICGDGFGVHNSPRNCYQSSMGKQAVGVPFSNYREIMCGSFHTLMYLQKPLCLTRAGSIVKFHQMPAGQNAIVAIMPRPFNEEDSIEINQDSIDRGFMVSFKWTCFYAEVKEENSELFGIPEDKNTERFRGDPRHLLPQGFPKPGTKIENGDIVIGKLIRNGCDDGGFTAGRARKKYTNASQMYDHVWPAVVDKVMHGTTGDGYRFIRVMLCQRREPIVGDKFSFMHGQKGTVGMKMRSIDLPFNSEGIAPDIIMNSLAIPSRMTIAMLIEDWTGKAIISTSKLHDVTVKEVLNYTDQNPGDDKKSSSTKPPKPKSGPSKEFKDMFCRTEHPSERPAMIDSTPFRKFDRNVIAEEMGKYGLRYGDEFLTDGVTGKRLRSLVFFGPAYSQRLKHMVVDKIHSRAKGGRTTLMRQPLEGRAMGGGLRFGVMERDCMLGQGSSKFVRDRLFICSDDYRTLYCDICGLIAGNPEDGCKVCGQNKLSMIRIPYGTKLVDQELMAMNIVPRILTVPRDKE